MDANAQQVIIAKAHEFVAELRAGRLEWSTEELTGYFLEQKKGSERVTVPEFHLGPIQEARAALTARVTAGLLGASVESGQVTAKDGRKTGGFIFSNVPESVPGVPQVVIKEVVKEVEKVVYKERDAQEPQDEVVFPGLPLELHEKPNFVEPEWYKLMEAALDSGRHVSLAGPPGGGKSTSPEQYFARRKQPCVVMGGDAGFRRRDMEGSTEVRSGSTWFRVAEFAAAAVNGWGVILNEVNAADSDALMFMNGILEVPFVVNIHGKAYPVHKDFRMVVTYNPGLTGTKPLPPAFKDRFFPIKLGFPPREFLRKMLIANGMDRNAQYQYKLLKFAEDCWDHHVKGTLRYQISPRRLFDVVFLMDSIAGMTLERAIKQAVVDMVDAIADAQVLSRLAGSL